MILVFLGHKLPGRVPKAGKGGALFNPKAPDFIRKSHRMVSQQAGEWWDGNSGRERRMAWRGADPRKGEMC